MLKKIICGWTKEKLFSHLNRYRLLLQIIEFISQNNEMKRKIKNFTSKPPEYSVIFQKTMIKKTWKVISSVFFVRVRSLALVSSECSRFLRNLEMQFFCPCWILQETKCYNAIPKLSQNIGNWKRLGSQNGQKHPSDRQFRDRFTEFKKQPENQQKKNKQFSHF